MRGRPPTPRPILISFAAWWPRDGRTWLKSAVDPGHGDAGEQLSQIVADAQAAIAAAMPTSKPAKAEHHAAVKPVHSK